MHAGDWKQVDMIDMKKCMSVLGVGYVCGPRCMLGNEKHKASTYYHLFINIMFFLTCNNTVFRGQYFKQIVCELDYSG